MRKAEFKAILNTYIAKEKECIKEHNEIKSILAPLKLKPIDGRTLSKKVLGDKFKFEQKFGMFYIVGERDHLIGYQRSENLISVEKIEGVSRGFEELDACNGYAAENRIKQIENIDLNKAFKVFNEIDKAFKKLQTLFGDIEREKLDSYHFPVHYDILKSICPNEEYIRIHQMYYLRK